MDNHWCDSIHMASKYGHSECLRTLIVSGADINAKDNFFEHNGWTPLHYASENGHLECIRILISSGADSNAKCKYGWTPLCYLALQDNKHDSIKLLLDLGLNLNEPTGFGKTALDIAKGPTKTVIQEWIEFNEVPIKEPES
jgi:ankyrin repeat protein